MKKLVCIASLVLLYGGIACTPEDKNKEGDGETRNNPEELTITGEALEVTDCSATLTGYANLPFELGDAEVGIMYDKVKSFEAAEKVVATGLDGNNKFTVTATGLEPSTTYYFKSYVQNGMAVKYGAMKSFTTSFFPVESVSLDETEYTFNAIGNTLTLQATVLPADATDKSIEWSSNNEGVAIVNSNGKVTAKSNGKATITVKTKDQEKTATCEITVAQWITSISLDKTSLPLGIGREVKLSVSILPHNANDKSCNWTTSDNTIASVDNNGKITAKARGEAIIKAIANDGSGVFDSCSVVVFAIPQAIDMGTVVNGKNIKWATFNCGAASPEEYGNYYAWGETEPKDFYSDLSDYKWLDENGRLTKYNDNSSKGTVDNKTVLDLEDDVAYMVFGGKWRMPTDEEWTALREQCTWTWTTQNGVNGRLVTSSNGNSFFLPAAGCRGFGELFEDGSIGAYRSSSLSTDPRYDWEVAFDYRSVERSSYLARYEGLSVRPVSE